MIDSSNNGTRQDSSNAVPTQRDELIVFAIIAALIWPVVAVGVVGGFGFCIWMSQLILGPPGPPGT